MVPLTSMLRGNKRLLLWSPSATMAFQQLKKLFTSMPILHHPDPELEFFVEVDTSNTGIGAILSQRQGNPPKLFVCAFYSRKLNSAEQNYDVGDLEILAMKAALEEWRHWLEGPNFPLWFLRITATLISSDCPNDSIHGRLDGPYFSLILISM